MRNKAPDIQVLETFPVDDVCVACGTNDDGLSVYVMEGDDVLPVHVVCAMPNKYSEQLGMFYRLTRTEPSQPS